MSKKKKGFFETIATKITVFAGSPIAFVSALLIVMVWAMTGPLFDFSETWQLVINTGTTVITFLMVFLIQKTQNKESKAMQLKLNELISASVTASNRMVDIEDLTEEEMNKLHKYYEKISKLAEQENDIHKSHSIGAAETLHRIKKQKANQRKAPDSNRGAGFDNPEQKPAAPSRRRKQTPDPNSSDKNAE